MDSSSRTTFRRVAWWCWYRGAGFAGFQAQAGKRTVQGVILEAFSRAGLERRPVVASRTDRGVSARMQVLGARLARHRDLEQTTAQLRGELPPDVGLFLGREAGAGFHPAWSASGKEYRYHLRPGTFDAGRLADAAALVPGTRDFRVFHHKTSAVGPRTVTAVELDGPPDAPYLRFAGHGFARYMVRMLAGALLGVARNEVPIDAVAAGLERQVNFGCPTADAAPLTLWEVHYPAQLDPFSAADRASSPGP